MDGDELVLAKLKESPAWLALQAHYHEVAPLHMRDLFEADPTRFEQFSLTFRDILLDFSKNRITSETLELLRDLARDADLTGWIERMFSGDRINCTEGTAALHVALRNDPDSPTLLDGEDVMPRVTAVRERIRELSDEIRSGSRRGYDGREFTDIVNIGIGGSDLGPVTVTEALKPLCSSKTKSWFVSSVDGPQLEEICQTCDPATTLFVVVSKSFATQETLLNARIARRWFVERARDERHVASHFLAVSANQAEVAKFGIDEANRIEMWDWVGGRYSLWSAAGLSIAIAIGYDAFSELLAGAHEMDEHFRSAPIDQNLPVTMALLGIWYNNFFGADTVAVLPYDQALHRFPAYLQQADMESNGKGVDRAGDRVGVSTGPIIWGEPGTNCQHAFLQLIHQGTKLIPCDFIAPVHSDKPLTGEHDALFANFFAQSEALMRGKDVAEVREQLAADGLEATEIEALVMHRAFEGNRPSNTILFDRLDPRTLGSLIALYEHKIFVQGVIWGINSFDQWGVELGKQLAESIKRELDGPASVDQFDSSTNGLINHYKAQR